MYASLSRSCVAKLVKMTVIELKMTVAGLKMTMAGLKMTGLGIKIMGVTEAVPLKMPLRKLKNYFKVTLLQAQCLRCHNFSVLHLLSLIDGF